METIALPQAYIERTIDEMGSYRISSAPSPTRNIVSISFEAILWYLIWYYVVSATSAALVDLILPSGSGSLSLFRASAISIARSTAASAHCWRPCLAEAAHDSNKAQPSWKKLLQNFPPSSSYSTANNLRWEKAK